MIVLTFEKVSQKIKKSRVGVRPVLDEIKIKATFVWGSSLSQFHADKEGGTRSGLGPQRTVKFP